jgi:bifunctional non-homologous end joining protein LigD
VLRRPCRLGFRRLMTQAPPSEGRGFFLPIGLAFRRVQHSHAPFVDGNRGHPENPCMRVSAFIEPCLPSPADRPPSGADWIHEIKLDGFRMMVRRDPAGVRLLTRNGYDWTGRFPLIAAAAETLRARSFLIDREAVACDGDGLPVFDRLRYRRQDGRVFLFAFDLLELNGRDMRREPLEVRKSALAGVLRRMKAWAGIQLNEHCDDLPVDVVFRHACKLGFEGIVSKRVGSPYRSGRSRDWLKMKNPNAPAVRREAEEDWGRARWR